jgi:hypothetical protein
MKLGIMKQLIAAVQLLSWQEFVPTRVYPVLTTHAHTSVEFLFRYVGSTLWWTFHVIGLFNDAVNYIDYLASNDRRVNIWWIRKILEGNKSSPNRLSVPEFPGTQTTESLSEVNLCLGLIGTQSLSNTSLWRYRYVNLLCLVREGADKSLAL